MRAMLTKDGQKGGIALEGAYEHREELKARGWTFVAGLRTWESPLYVDVMDLYREYSWVRQNMAPEAVGTLAQVEAVWDTQIAPAL